MEKAKNTVKGRKNLIKNKMELFKQIVASQFIQVDLGLFLNTHPMDQEALAKYNFYVMESKGLKECYQMNYGMLCQCDTLSPYPCLGK